MRKSVNENKT